MNRNRWKARVAAAAQAIQGVNGPSTDNVEVQIEVFLAAPMVGDIDNVIKPILDALCNVVYVDDNQVDKVSSCRWLPNTPIDLSASSVSYAGAVTATPPVVYVRIDRI